MIRQRSIPTTRGLATVFALIMLGLVTFSITAATVLVRVDARRTAAMRTDAQLRQLLLAGVAAGVAHSASWASSAPAEKWSIPLPSDPRLAGATLTAATSLMAPNVVVLTITARLDNLHASEQLRFTGGSGHWQLSGIQLDQ